MLQLVFYLGAHPRIDLLCATVSKIINGLIHYAIIFMSLFFLLGYYAHWMFAGSLPGAFGTFQNAMLKQAEMLVGYADAWPWQDMKFMDRTEYVSFVLYLS